MNKACILLLWFFSSIYFNATAQTFRFLDSSQTGVSFRGMSIGSDGAVWVSGSKGTIGMSRDEGKSWQWVNPPGYETRDFRDIHAFDWTTALAMAVDSPGVILRTIDAGKTWEPVYKDDRKGIFLDALTFRNNLEGICVGDAIGGKMVVIATRDGGKSWNALPPAQCPDLLPGEAMFAASGSNVIPHPRSKESYLAVTGGQAARMWEIFPWNPKLAPKSTTLPIQQGMAFTGANAIISAKKHIMVVGGNFDKPQRSDSNFVYRVKRKPFKLLGLAGGYKSSIADNLEFIRVACGTSGISIHSAPYGSYPKPWKVFSNERFHVVRVLPFSKNFFLAGPNGKIGMVSF